MLKIQLKPDGEPAEDKIAGEIRIRPVTAPGLSTTYWAA
jgi:hypothetical protein